MYQLLIVDDEAQIRELVKKYAVFEGYSTCEASNGLEAIEKVKITVKIKIPFVDFSFVPLKILFLKIFSKIKINLMVFWTHMVL